MKTTSTIFVGILALLFIWQSKGVQATTSREAILDSLQAGRDRHVATLLEKYKGREQEKAGTIFPNLKIASNQEMPLDRFLRQMNAEYSRGLGVPCSFCHNTQKWEDGSSGLHVFALDMAKLTETTNAEAKKLASFEQRRGDLVKCSTCHHGEPEPPRLPPLPGERRGGGQGRGN